MKKTFLLILFILAFSQAHSSEKQDATVPVHAVEANANQNQAQENAVDTPPAIESADSPSKSESASPYSNNNHVQDNKGHKETLLWGYKLSNILAFLALILTAIFGGAGIWLSFCGLKQNRISNEKQNRAYVTITSCKIVPIENGMVIKVSFKNLGMTPAHITGSNNWWGFMPEYNDMLPHDENIEPVDLKLYLGPSDIKSHKVYLHKGNAIPEEVFDTFITGKSTFMFDGALYFTDEFGVKHETSFHFKRKSKQGEHYAGEMTISEKGINSKPV